VFSATHPDPHNWYNNNSPTLSWGASADSEGFNYVLDNKPQTIPESTLKTTDSAVSFSKLTDGLWYFHIKEKKHGVWGAISHFLIKIDTVPPVAFQPIVNTLTASSFLSDWIPVSFFTTDNLSGVAHYEVGTIDKSQPITSSPSFIQTESPFLVSLRDGARLAVVVRAVDKAGNVRDATIKVEKVPATLISVIGGRFAQVLLITLLMILEGYILYYIFKHRILNRLRRVFKAIKREEKIAEISENADDIDEELYQSVIAKEAIIAKEIKKE
jgi:hypothetical protein